MIYISILVLSVSINSFLFTSYYSVKGIITKDISNQDIKEFSIVSLISFILIIASSIGVYNGFPK